MTTDTPQPRVMALYHFVKAPMADSRVASLRESLLERCASGNILGTLLLAPEGINGTVNGDQDALDGLAEFLMQQPEFVGHQLRSS